MNRQRVAVILRKKECSFNTITSVWRGSNRCLADREKGKGTEMDNVTKKTKRALRRGMAFVMAFVLCVSTLAVSSSADAVASKRKPLIGRKSKTLYYNVKNKRTYTLKIKKNKVRRIKQTTWKTSKRSVVAISNKKKTSVKLTAKKKGNATITATVKYIPKGGWWTRTAKLKCKVKSKQAAGVGTSSKPSTSPKPPNIVNHTPTPTPNYQKPTNTPPVVTPPSSGNPTDNPTGDPTGGPTDNPTGGPTDSPLPAVVAKVALDKTEAVLSSTAEGRDTVKLTASVQDSDGNEIADRTPEWTSDNEAVASVDETGLVRAISDGQANITATLDGVKSEPCAVTVDSKAPAVEGAIINGYNTIAVYFDEMVEGIPQVTVSSSIAAEPMSVEAALAKDGKSVLVTSEQPFPAATYTLTVSGLTDLAGNILADNKATVVREESKAGAFVCDTEQIPCGQKEVKVYYSVLDQYGQKFEYMAIENLQASAETESGMPLETKIKNDGLSKGYVIISGAIGTLAEGKKINITLKSGELTKTISTVLVNSQGVGVATSISGVNVSSEKMENSGTQEEPVFALRGTDADNVFSLSLNLLDEFNLPAKPSDVTYVIEDTSILAFSDTEVPNTNKMNTSKEAVQVKALRGGQTTITAYLVSDDTVRLPIKITITPTRLTNIAVAPLPEGINGRESEAEVSLNPEGTGIAVDDLEYTVTEGEDKLKSLKLVEEDGKFYARITANTNSEDNVIKFVVSYDMGTPEDKADDVVSKEITYLSSPLSTGVTAIEINDFEEQAITAGGTGSTTYILRNRYGEDITKRVVSQPAVEIADPSVIAGAVVGAGEEAGTLSVVADAGGETEITLSIGKVSATVKVKVMSTARVNQINLLETKKDLILGDTDAVYVAINTFDQYENPYTMKGGEAAALTAKINGVAADSSADISITWCKKNGNGYSACKENDPVEAIGIAWNEPVSAISGNEIKVTFDNGNINDSSEKPFTSDTLTIAVKSQRAVKTLEFAEKNKVAAAGAQVSNTIRVKDQYGQPISLDSQKTIGIRVTDSDNKVVTVTSSIKPEGGRKTFEQMSMLDKSGTYTITAYLKDNETTTFEQAKVKASYTLKVDEQKNLIHRIEVSDTVTILKDGEEDKTVSLSQAKSIHVGGSGNPTKLKFDYKVFDEDGNEVALNDADGNPVIPANELIWTAQGTSTTKVTKGEAPDIFLVEIIDGETQGSVSVQLDYVRGGVESAPFVIPVSKESSIPQDGTYKVVTYDNKDGNEVLGKENVISQGYEMEDTADGQTFAVTAQDQYGETCQDISLYTVTSSDNDVASVEVMSGQNGNTNKFIVVPQTQGEAVIHVYVSKSLIYSFTVTVVEGKVVVETYTITYDAGEGKGTEKQEEVESGSDLKLKTPAELGYVAPDGQIFVKWKVMDESGAEVKDLTDYKVTGNLTATAIWEDIAGTVEYTITYKDGNTEIGTDKVASGSSLSLKTLEELEYTAPSGKTFAKWKVTDESGAEVKDLTDYKVTGNLTATAIWEDIAGTVEYTITYKDGNTEIGTDKVASGSSLSLKTLEELKYSAPSGKTFAKWKVTDESGAEVKDLTDYKVTGNLTATAVWEDIAGTVEYTITYKDGNTEIGTDKVASGSSLSLKTLEELEYTAPSGKKFVGWKVTDKSGVEVENLTDYKVEGNLTATAVWGYKITYSDGKETGDSQEEEEEEEAGSELKLLEPTDFGYVAPDGQIFVKWKVMDESGAEVENLTNYKVEGNLTATAVWGYEITYNANGGEESGEMSVGKATAGEAFTLPECKFAAPAGKEFSHWAVKNENDEYEKLEATHTFEADTTVYAIWKDSVAEN